MEKTIDRSEDELYNGWWRKLDTRLLIITQGRTGATGFHQDQIHGCYMQSKTVHETTSILLYGEGGSDGKKSPPKTQS